MKKLCLFIAAALLLSCNTVPAKNNNAKEFNKFASFNATGEIERVVRQSALEDGRQVEEESTFAMDHASR